MAYGEAASKLTTQLKVLLALTLALSGRAMTLAFIRSAGSPDIGAPPAAWLMPLVGDAVIGLSAFAVAYLILRGRGLFAWTAIVAWNVLGIWDALSAYLVHLSVPWPDFFMIRSFGSSIFFAASALHLANLWIVFHPDGRSRFQLR